MIALTDGAPELLDGSTSIRVVTAPRPFSTDRYVTHLPEGLSLQEMVDRLGLPRAATARVFIDDVLIPEKQWAWQRPKRGRVVSIRVIPRGGGGDSNKLLRTVLQVVIIIAVAVVIWATGGLGSAAAPWIMAAGAALSIAVNLLLPPQFPKMNRLAAIAGTSNNPESAALSIGGTQNRATPYDVIPRIIGRHRIFPPLGALPYTEIVGNDQFLRMLFCPGYGPLDLTDFKIGETALSAFQGVEIEVRQGYENDPPLTLFTQQIIEEPLSVALTGNGGRQVRTSQLDADELSVDVSFPNGLTVFHIDGEQTPASVTFAVEYRVAGTDDPWLSVPGSPFTADDTRASLVRTGWKWKPQQPTTEQFGAAFWTASGLAFFDPAKVNDGNTASRCFDADPAAPGSYLHFDAGVDQVRGFLGIDIWSAGTGLNAIWDVQYSDDDAAWTAARVGIATGAAAQESYSWATVGAHRYWRLLKTNAASTGPDYFEVRWSEATRQQYEVGITRLTGDTTDPLLVHDASVWSALRTIRNQDPITKRGVAKVALRIRATDQINGIVDQLNCIATAIMPDWDSGTNTWITRATRNPASSYRAILQGPGNARPVPNSRLDLTALQEWHEDNTAASRNCDLVFDFRTTVFEALRDVAAVGRAAFSMRDGLFTVVRDITQSVPIQHFSPRNSKNFKGRKAFPDVVHAFKVRFVNPDANWQLDERIVYDDGFDETNASKFEVLEALGCTDASQAWKMGRYQLAAIRLRPEIYELTTDVEYLVCRVGDLVKVAHDVPQFGLKWGRVKALSLSGGNVVGVLLDEEVEMVGGTSYSIRFRLSDGTSLLSSVVTVPGITSSVTLASPITSPRPAVGDLALFGVMGSESVDCIVKSILPGPDLSATLQLVDYAPGIQQAETGTIPTFNSQITQQAELHRTPPVPIIDSVKSDETVLVRNIDGTLVSRILINLHYSAVSDIKTDFVEVRFRRSDSTSPFLSLPRLAPDITEITIMPVEEGVAYNVMIRSVNLGGPTSAWITIANHTVVGKSSPPPDPTNLTFVEDRLLWEYTTPPPDLLGFKLRRSPGAVGTWASGIPMHIGTWSASPFILPTLFDQWAFMVKAVDTSGNESTSAAELTVDFGQPLIHNAVATKDFRALGFPGTITNGTVNGGTGNLEADQVPTGFWSSDTARFWSTTPALTLFWGGTYKQLTYDFTWTTPATATGTALIFNITVIASGWNLYYRVGGSGDYLLWPGSLPGIIALQQYDFRLVTEASATQGVVSQLLATLDAEDIVEEFSNVAIAAGGTRLPITETYRALKTVQATVVASGVETAIAAKVEDMDATLGPLIKTYDAGGSAVAGHVNARVTGY